MDPDQSAPRRAANRRAENVSHCVGLFSFFLPIFLLKNKAIHVKYDANFSVFKVSIILKSYGSMTNAGNSVYMYTEHTVM